MQLRRLLAAGAFALAATAALPAAAQQCANFVDVLASSPFCPSVEWLKNRQITTGCGDGSAYCPNDAVTRLAMAAFMQRLGVALTPTFVRKREPGPLALNFSGQQVVCKTAAVPVTGYPRAAIVRGTLNLFTPNGGMDVEAKVVYSTDGGTSFTTPVTNDGFAYGALSSAGTTPPNDITLHPMTAIDLNVGTTYVFALAAQKVAASGGTGDIANIYCENLVQLVNRNGATSPLDADVLP
ncbi:MAG TPA: hypothetical protein VFX05_01885, partial [Casimicrobiaceae bacterium]|nr:hypothetical protein [Casimicrobiaceae bacterium]